MKMKICLGAVLTSFALVGAFDSNGFVPSDSAQLSGVLSEGVTMTMSNTAGGKTTTITQYFSANATKSTSPDVPDNIVRFDQQKLISVDHKKKTYSEMTFQQIQEMVDKAGKAMAGLPDNPEAAAAIKKMMGAGNSGPLTVTKQGPGEAIAGYATERYVVSGPLDMEIWAAPDLKVPAAYYDAIKIRMPSNPMFDMRQMYEAFKQINGWPLKSVTTMKMMGRSMTTTMEVTSVQKGAIPASTFEVPAGYKLVQEKF